MATKNRVKKEHNKSMVELLEAGALLSSNHRLQQGGSQPISLNWRIMFMPNSRFSRPLSAAAELFVRVQGERLT
jgi:hypothetical protein